MPTRTQIAALALLAIVAFGSSASAQGSDPINVFIHGNVHYGSSPLLAVSNRVHAARSNAEIDYAVFVRELVAFTAKEVLPDADDEYAGSLSRIPSRLSPDMPKSDSRFSDHCLIVLAQIGSFVSPVPQAGAALLPTSTVSALSYIARAGTTILAVGRAVSDLRNREQGERESGFSLRPKVSSSKIGAYVTFTW